MIKIPLTSAVDQHHNLKLNNLDIFLRVMYLNRVFCFLIDIKTKDFELLGTKIVLGDTIFNKEIVTRCVCSYQSGANPYAFDDFELNRAELFLL